MTDPTPTPAAQTIGHEWQPCVKLPITVHVREQRPGESHVSTREGITPVRQDDLIMRGVQGEEYPIGRELFNRTYRLGEATPPAAAREAPPVPTAEDMDDLADDLLGRVLGPGEGARLIGRALELWGNAGPSSLQVDDLVGQLRPMDPAASEAVAPLPYGCHAPVPPQGAEISDRELLELMPQQLRDAFAEAARCCALSSGSEVLPGIFRVVLNTAAMGYARPAIQPVPVSERPWGREGWCDAEGHCWRFDPCERGWWSYGAPTNLMGSPVPWTHMAPHWALPRPAANQQEGRS
jgi:hypothetical protein